MDGLLLVFDIENIWSIFVIGVLVLIVFSVIISLGYKKKFIYVLVVGNKIKYVYELYIFKFRLIVKKYIGVDRVYLRGFY